MKAPSGAFAGPTPMPAMLQVQGAEQVDASPTRIARMLQEVFRNEEVVAKLESEARKDPAYRDYLAQARRLRDEHVAEIKHLTDYALTMDAYENVTCGCVETRLPESSVTEFIQELSEGEGDRRPAMDCKKCHGYGSIRKKKKDPASKKRFKRIGYFQRVTEDTTLCAKIRANTSDSDAAYVTLEAKNRNLMVKFSNEKQTSLEGDDASQGVRQGIIDAAMRFDPTRPEMASFNTVAYKWCFRNSRARQFGQRRAGVYSPSIDGMGSDVDGNGVAALISDSDGSLGVLPGSGGSAPCKDTCSYCGDVSAIDTTTWKSLGVCEACKPLKARDEKKRKSPKEQPGCAYAPRGQVKACPKDLSIDLRAQMAELPELQRGVLDGELRGWTMTKISEEIGVSTAKVRKLREAAHETLRDSLAGYAECLRD